MGHEPEKKPASPDRDTEKRHTQFPQESWTEIDAEGTDSEMAEGREDSEPFYTPLVSEAAERRLKKSKKKGSKDTGEKPAA